MDSSSIGVRTLVNTADVGVIIGKGGQNVQIIREETGCKVRVSEFIPGTTERILTIYGSPDNIAKVLMSGVLP